MEVGFKNSKLWSKRQIIWNSLIPFGLHIILFMFLMAVFLLLFLSLSRFGKEIAVEFSIYETSEPKHANLIALGNYRIALNIFDKFAISSNETDVLLSPLSLLTSMMMLLEGSAEGSEYGGFKHIADWSTVSRSEFHRNMRKVLESFKHCDENSCVTMNTTLFLNKERQLESRYMDTLTDVYKADVLRVDFDEKNQSRIEMIQRLGLKETDYTILVRPVSNDVGVISNSLKFEAHWQFPFALEDTTIEEFSISDERRINMTVMHQTQEFGFGEFNGIKILRLPYKGKNMEMYVLMPENNRTIKWVRAKILSDVVTYVWEIDKHLEMKKLDVCLPRMKMNWTGSLNSLLSEAGLSSLFFENPKEGTHPFSDVLQFSSLAVKEAGTEASSSTFSILTDRESSDFFCATRPFIFFVRDTRLKTLLFIGQFVGKSS